MDTIYLGYFYANSQYLIDTAQVMDGAFNFSGDEPLKPGVYLVVMPPENHFFQLLIDSTEQQFSFEAEAGAIERTITFDVSGDNALFYDHLRYLEQQRSKAKNIQAEIENANIDIKSSAQEKLNDLNKEVMVYQHQLIREHPKTITAILIASGFQPDVPEFEGSSEEISLQQYIYFKRHYFDYTDLADPRMIRTPKNVLFDKVDHYMEKLTPVHPDSIITSLDYLLSEMEKAPETYKYFLVYFLNNYAQSKIVGMDKVYVHLVENYYGKGKAPWLDHEKLTKILNEASAAKPTLVGNIAPNFEVQRRDGTSIRLTDIHSPYTILIFWAPDCNHCKKSMPELKTLHEEYNTRGVEVFAVCTKVNELEPDCWNFIDENGLDSWINASDKYGGKSLIHRLYNIKTTPRLFLLDEKKEILTKGVGVEQLPEILDHYVNVTSPGAQK